MNSYKDSQPPRVSSAVLEVPRPQRVRPRHDVGDGKAGSKTVKLDTASSLLTIGSQHITIPLIDTRE